MSNRNRRYNSSSDFTTPGLANEASTAATRDAVRGDVYGSQTTFQAIVLAQPLPMDSTQTFELYGVDHRGSANVVPTFQFKGRIVGGDLPSPHEFLPDPCKLDRTVNWQTTLDLIAQHTTFVSEAGYDGAVPSVGDLVEVELEAGDVKYNLQFGTFKNIVNSAVIETRNLDSRSCQSMLSIFENLDGEIEPDTTIGEIFEGRPPAGRMASEVEVIQGTGLVNPGNHKALPGVSQWLEDVVTVMNGVRAAGAEAVNLIPHATNSAREVDGCPGGLPSAHRDGVAGTTPWTITITSGYRAPADQARAMMGLRADNFGQFGYRYEGADGDNVFFGEWVDDGDGYNLQTAVNFGDGKANWSDLPDSYKRTPIMWPPRTYRVSTMCNGVSIARRGMCKQGFTWATSQWPKVSTLQNHIRKDTDPYQYKGTTGTGNGYSEGSPTWGVAWGSDDQYYTLRPNATIYHIWRLYSISTTYNYRFNTSYRNTY